MKLVNRYFLLLTLWLGVAAAARAQVCPSPNQPACTFDAVDNVSGQVVTSFCVGKPVRFVLACGRNILPTELYYGVRPGVSTVFPGCKPSTSPNAATFVYTPTRADVGPVTVSELATADPTAPGGSTYYIRNYQVYDNVAPAFTVAPCPSSNALITITDLTYDFYSVQFGTNPPVNLAPGQRRAVVPVPGGATSVTVTGHYTAPNICESLPATQNIAPLPPPQTPLFTTLTLLAPLPGGTATLAIGQLPTGYLYTLQRTDASVPGGFATVASLPANASSFTLTGAVAGGYRVRRTDPCHLDSAFSPLRYPLSLRGTSTQNSNQLLFDDGGSPGTTYTVTRDGNNLPGFTPIAGGGGLEDATGECGTSYRYVVTATYPDGGKSVSNEVTILTASTLPPARPLLLASFNVRNVVELTPLLASPPLGKGSTLFYRRTAGANAPADYGTATTLRPQRDSSALTELRKAPPCYSVRVVDVCGNASAESPSTCPALLAARPTDAAGTTTALTWSAFTGPDPTAPATYVLQRLGPDFSVLPNPVPVSGGSYTDLGPPTDEQVLRYRLQISGAGLPASAVSYSNVATVMRPLFLTIPTAFTPNGDGLNDVLEVKGKYLKDYTFVIVDRNGQEVFRGSQRADVWDGRIQGHAPVLGTYVWRFRQDNADGTPFTASGSVTILK
ncbi:T9SS type B sorting domain-containing protein [Hymenobacter ruricola]|uniref:Gliding motility-associated C-terminal domain-containing protein n=1 Tax=Hymenobacter ruricola TaxID=2791023 RepID=A0ABS0I1J5_9BACT|nr:gliding motility-associated C-terminal domain-containing protein [Hymenobacter ruricola]MBF9220804.1 gliding motility-associated C-terminal domain-containing protein [Hymenobacter ruricola]